MNKTFKKLVSATVPAMVVAGVGAAPAAGDEVHDVLSQAIADLSTLPVVEPEAPAPPQFMPPQIYDVIDGIRG